MGGEGMLGRGWLESHFINFFYLNITSVTYLLFRTASVTSNLTVSISPFLIIFHISYLSIHDIIAQFQTVSCDGC